MITDAQRVIFESAAESYRQQNKISWRFAALAACSGGTYKDLADFIGGISPDKVESAAHAWEMYRDLWRAYGSGMVYLRRMDYVYIAHFKALHAMRRKYGVGLDVCFRYLLEVYQGEGAVSSRDLATQADREFGTERALPWEADKARSALARLRTRGDLATLDRHLFAQALERLEQLSG